MKLLDHISESLQQGKAKKVCALVDEALSEGIAAASILSDGLLNGMNIIGQQFKENEIFIPDVLVAARAMKKGSEKLKPYLIEEGVESKGTIVIGTVEGDLHDIGKNLVAMMMEGKGFEVIDTGVDTSPDQFVQAALDHNADIIACSALLTTTMMRIKQVIEAVESAGIRDQVTIMVGGAPVTQLFADSVGADLYTPDAASAADAALNVVTQKDLAN